MGACTRELPHLALRRRFTALRTAHAGRCDENDGRRFMPDAGSCSSFLGAAFGCVHGSGIHSLDDVLLWRRSLERCACVRRVVVHMVPSRRGSCSSVAVAYFHACLQVATAAFLFLQRAMLACSAG